MWKISHEYDGDLIKPTQKDLSMTDEEFDIYINKKGNITSPFKLPNIQKAIDRIKEAILNNENIGIACDYDVDGCTSCAIMMLGLLQLTSNVTYYMPNRNIDGYGISKRQVDECIKDNINLIISVDTGIAEHKSIKYAQEHGIDVIVTDHHPHNSSELPCDIVVDPYLDDNIFHGICGAMVAYKVIRALIPDIKILAPELNLQMIALATIGTVGDAMPLIDENRIFVYHGLKLIDKTDNIGLNTLLRLNKIKEIDENAIGFAIAPLINAAGRMDDASQVVELFLCDDEIKAEKIVKNIISLNEKRKELQTKLLEQVTPTDDPVIIQEFKNVPGGVLGIVANQIVSKYNKPCFAIVKGKEFAGGSGRSIPGYDLSRNIINNKDLGIDGGGHSEACALSIKTASLNEFKKRCNEDFSNWLKTHEHIESDYLIDYLISFQDISFDLIDKINMFRPFGNANKEFIFCSKNVEVLKQEVIGKKKNALKFTFRHDYKILEGICFNTVMNSYLRKFGENHKYLNIAYTIGINTFRGKSIQLMLCNFAKPNDAIELLR